MSDLDNITVVTGTKEDLDTASLWAHACLVSAFGQTEGDKAFKSMPALIAFVLWRLALDQAPEA